MFASRCRAGKIRPYSPQSMGYEASVVNARVPLREDLRRQFLTNFAVSVTLVHCLVWRPGNRSAPPPNYRRSARRRDHHGLGQAEGLPRRGRGRQLHPCGGAARAVAIGGVAPGERARAGAQRAAVPPPRARLILTEQGDLLYRTAHDVFMKLEAVRTKLTDSREKPNGELRINTTAGIGVHWLTPRLGEFFDLYPDIRITLITSDEELDLAMREADVAIRLRQPTQSDLIQRKLFSMHFHAYASPEYLKRSGTPRSLEDLDRHRIMVLGGNAPNYLQDVHSVCRAQASGGSLPRGRESFFECLHDVGVLLVGLGPGAHMGEAQVLQGTVDRIVGDRDAKLLVEPHDQIAGPPAHNTMDRWDRALFHTAGEKCLVCVRQLARRARGRPVDETLRSLLVEPDHPVPQRLTVHSADLCRVFPRGAVEHRCDRQQPACLRRILHPLRNATNIAACIVRPHRNGSPHGKRPSVCHLESRYR